MGVADVKFKRPTAAKESKGLLRYLTYRDGRYGHIQQEAGNERWIDHGMGASVGEIASRCDDYQSKHVLAFTLVFNPNPDLIAMVPLEDRETFVKTLTETALDRFYEARGTDGGIEYSYVLHHRASEDPESPGLHDPHTHVILPGTFFDEGKGLRTGLYFNQNNREKHIDMLHEATEQTVRDLMDRYAVPDWEQRYDVIAAEREQQRRVVEEERHGGLIDGKGRGWEFWYGARRTGEETSAVGYYREFPKDKNSKQTEFEPDEVQLEFRPVASGLTPDWANRLARLVADYVQQHPTTDRMALFDEIAYVGSLSPAAQDDYMDGMFGRLHIAFPAVEVSPEPDEPPPDQERDDPEQPTWSGPSLDF